MELLKLAALDTEDLTVISAHLQDAILRPEDLSYLPGEKRFVLALRRFDWSAGPTATPTRRLAGLHFERVLSVRTKGLRPGSTSGEATPLSVLAITFTPSDPPSGHIEILFSGNATIRLEVECIEARMKDLGPVWEASARPGHDTAPGTAA
ncbi:MAG: DUF2948 family protein [Parafilimonas terrae]|nr:DUF2948 family protein [Parafilimonas terrae]